MSHLYRPRVGWECERLAHYLLSRFSFVAQPTSIADDVGSDFYCTIFEVQDRNPPVIDPRTSFAIQIKSSKGKIEAHNKVDFLKHLDIPFFIGIVNEAELELRIYSGEHFSFMSAVFGYRKQLWLQPIDDQTYALWQDAANGEGVVLNCPFVCSFHVKEQRFEFSEKVQTLLKRCQRTVANIGSRRAEEHIYEIDENPQNVRIVAGCGSVKVFRDNVCKRLAEAFFNFHYMLNQDPGLFNLQEFEVYEQFLLSLQTVQEGPMLSLAERRYKDVKALLVRMHPATEGQLP